MGDKNGLSFLSLFPPVRNPFFPSNCRGALGSLWTFIINSSHEKISERNKKEWLCLCICFIDMDFLGLFWVLLVMFLFFFRVPKHRVSNRR